MVINEGEVISVRVIQSANNGSIKWANTHEYVALVTLNYDEQSQVAATIANAHAGVLLSPYRVEKVVVSTWVPDGQPYDPDTFVSFPFNLPGQRSRTSSDPVDLAVTLRIDRRSVSGRAGRMLLRGVLTEEMLYTVGGRYNYQAPGGLDGVDWAAGTAALGSLINIGGGLQMVMASSAGTRNVAQLTIAGVSIKKLNNKYFNRGT